MNKELFHRNRVAWFLLVLTVLSECTLERETGFKQLKRHGGELGQGAGQRATSGLWLTWLWHIETPAPSFLLEARPVGSAVR